MCSHELGEICIILVEGNTDGVPTHSASIYNEDNVRLFHVPVFQFLQGFVFFFAYFVLFAFCEGECSEFKSDFSKCRRYCISFDEVCFEHCSSSGYCWLRDTYSLSELPVASM